jgi:predicted transposase YbfD/YdcC
VTLAGISLAALDHAHGVVLGQVDVEAKTNEIPMFATVLDRIDLTGAVVTADALHAPRAHAEYLVTRRQAHYLITVKRNQPGLHAQLAALPWRQMPVAHEARERGHGRAERRTLKVTAVAAGLAFPHAAQAIQIVRRRRPLTGTPSKKWSTETVYAVTSLTAIQAQPAELAQIVRGHWGIEDRLHSVRDVTYDEDRSQVRTGNGPRVMANLAIAILRLTGHASILLCEDRVDGGEVISQEHARKTLSLVALNPSPQPPEHVDEQRYTFVSVLSDSGVDIEQIADAVGHINSAVTKAVCRHQIADEVTSVATAVDAIFGEAKGSLPL